MEIFAVIDARRSIRSFTGGPVSCADLEKIVNAGRLAASGMNAQPWEFVVVTERDIIRQLSIPEGRWTRTAGAIIAVIMDPTSRWWVEDGAAATQNMLLACTALGYGACWIEGYTQRNEQTFRQVLCIPENLKLFTLIAVGIPTEPVVKEKKRLDEVLHWQRYSVKPVS